MKTRWILFFILVLSPLLWAAEEAEFENEDDLVNRYRYRIEKTLNDANGFRQTKCVLCSNVSAGDGPKVSPACRKTYKKFYNIRDRIEDERPQDRVIEIRVAFGYMDYLRSVDDSYAVASFATQMTARCVKGRHGCGFVQDPDDAELFTKQIKIMGPDGNYRPRLVKLRMRSSSVTGDERRNRDSRGKPTEEQAEQSAATREFFHEGLSQSDMVLYVGHARDGGGPDFGPPHVNPETRRTDYAWHRSHPEGKDGMIEALRSSPSPAKIVGVFACYARNHFGQALREAAPGTGFLLSGRSEFEATVGQAAASIDNVMSLKCENEFKQSLGVVRAIGDYQVDPVTVDGVFRR